MKLKELIDELIRVSKEDCNEDATVYVNGKKNFTIKSNYLTRVDIKVSEGSSNE
ncbi:hypothetical protein [Bullifex porci]|uniref:hypothetical protein n=1 Tax=Bullifex porci TaxID=2606638 RepID=UPI0023F01487|nr:hypothetical protein [Bullifex porci]MDD7256233.1 hypothetical protein [Bullifex porci]